MLAENPHGLLVDADRPDPSIGLRKLRLPRWWTAVAAEIGDRPADRELRRIAVELLRRYLRQSAAVENDVDFAVPRARKLSDRERQVLTHLIRGRTNKTIAQRLGVLESTVKTQVGRIYDKLEVRTRLDLLSLAIERGWVEESPQRKAARG